MQVSNSSAARSKRSMSSSDTVKRQGDCAFVVVLYKDASVTVHQVPVFVFTHGFAAIILDQSHYGSTVVELKLFNHRHMDRNCLKANEHRTRFHNRGASLCEAQNIMKSQG
jgi:hypothetical protein